MKGRSIEELAREVNNYMEKYPHTNRHRIKKATGINDQKLFMLRDMGLVKLPAPVKPGSRSIGWRLDNRKLART